MKSEEGVVKRTDGPISRYINRKISWRISRFIVNRGIGITPNQMSIISFLTSLASLPLFLYSYPLLAGIIVQVSSILDGVDGEIARLRDMSSRFGGFLDSLLDRLADISIIIGCSLYLLYYKDMNTEYLITISLLAISASLMVSYLHGAGQSALGIHPALVGRVRGVASRDVRLFTIFIFSVIGLLDIALVIISILGYSYIFIKLIEVSRIY